MEQRERIISTALQMFTQQGVKEVRMDDIASQLAMSKRTLYEMFSNKENLLMLALQYYMHQKQLKREALSLKSSNILEAIFSVLKDEMDNTAETTRFLDSVKRYYPQIADKMHDIGNIHGKAQFDYCFAKGKAEGLFSDKLNVNLAFTVLRYTTSALFIRKDLEIPDGYTNEDAIFEIIVTFFRGIATPAGIKMLDEFIDNELKRTNK